MTMAVYNAGRVKRGLNCCSMARGLGDGEDTNFNAPVEWGDGYYTYYDQAAGIYYDEYGNQWDVGGVGYWDDPALYDPILVSQQTTTLGPDSQVNLSRLYDTQEWQDLWNGAPVQLPNATVPASYILQIPDSGIIPPGLILPPTLNALPPSTLAKIKAALAKIAKNVSLSAGSGSGAAAGGRPQAVQANAQGQCPPGYQKTAAGQCALVSGNPPSTATTGFLSNPLFLLLAAIGLVILAKR